MISYLNTASYYKALYRDFTDRNTGSGKWRECVLISFQVPAVGILKEASNLTQQLLFRMRTTPIIQI